MKKPHYSLARIKQLVAERKVYISRTRGLGFFPTARAAHELVRHICAELTVKQHFVRTVHLAVDVADEYGIRVDNVGWYVKVYVDETVPEASFISLHPLEYPIQTNGGIVIP